MKQSPFKFLAICNLGFIFTVATKAYFEKKGLRFSRHKITSNEIKKTQSDN